MLIELYIENFAVIEKASIGFSAGFNVFTGETGAGKSMLIGGIGAVMGARVSKDLVRQGQERALAVARFGDWGGAEERETVQSALAANGINADIEADEALIISREIHADGKSTARIGGRPVSAAILREITGLLLDLHGQQDSRMLMSGEYRRYALDAFAGNGKLRAAYAEVFRQFQAATKRLKKLREQAAVRAERMAELTEKIEAVSALDMQPGDETELETELSRLRNAAFISQSLERAVADVSGLDDERGAYAALTDMKNTLDELSDFLPECGGLSLRAGALLAEMDDIRAECAALIPDETDENRLALLEEKQSDIRRLERKSGRGIAEILNDLAKWRDELSDLQIEDEAPLIAEEERAGFSAEVKRLAAELTLCRKTAAAALSARIAEQLNELNMPNARIIIDVTDEKFTVNGANGVNFLISANAGEAAKPLERIASGGELSRIMLAIKSVMAECEPVPTMIFDEIDTGISGKAANKVGEKLAGIAKNRQVICVTHLAQIAAKANRHFLIEKQSDETSTRTEVHSLNLDARKRELARIISGSEDSETAQLSAMELLGNQILD
jgi:DNA repair protein RecN (Recombination protein N)